jgi:hypothetical protein
LLMYLFRSKVSIVDIEHHAPTSISSAARLICTL